MLSGADQGRRSQDGTSVVSAFLGAYGASIEIVASDEPLLRSLLACLPCGWQTSSAGVPDEWRFHAVREVVGFRTVDGAGDAATWADVDGVQAALREELRRYVGFHTPDMFFVHAGVVAYENSVIVLPGQSFAGKSTLVGALVRAGAEFYSDEYAIFDRCGRVVQYREPLIVRGANGREETAIAAEGPDRPLPVGLVGITTYREGAAWSPRRLTTAEGVVAMLEHASRARPRAAAAIATLRLAVQNATVLLGQRGDADATAEALLAAAAHSPRIDGRSR